jgi:hypothetical protein
MVMALLSLMTILQVSKFLKISFELMKPFDRYIPVASLQVFDEPKRISTWF